MQAAWHSNMWLHCAYADPWRSVPPGLPSQHESGRRCAVPAPGVHSAALLARLHGPAMGPYSYTSCRMQRGACRGGGSH